MSQIENHRHCERCHCAMPYDISAGWKLCETCRRVRQGTLAVPPEPGHHHHCKRCHKAVDYVTGADSDGLCEVCYAARKAAAAPYGVHKVPAGMSMADFGEEVKKASHWRCTECGQMASSNTCGLCGKCWDAAVERKKASSVYERNARAYPLPAANRIKELEGELSWCKHELETSRRLCGQWRDLRESEHHDAAVLNVDRNRIMADYDRLRMTLRNAYRDECGYDWDVKLDLHLLERTLRQRDAYKRVVDAAFAGGGIGYLRSAARCVAQGDVSNVVHLELKLNAIADALDALDALAGEEAE